MSSTPRPILRDPEVVRRQSHPCLNCAFVVSAVTHRGLREAMEAHTDYVNATADRASDPHFEDLRLEALMRG